MDLDEFDLRAKKDLYDDKDEQVKYPLFTREPPESLPPLLAVTIDRPEDSQAGKITTEWIPCCDQRLQQHLQHTENANAPPSLRFVEIPPNIGKAESIDIDIDKGFNIDLDSFLAMTNAIGFRSGALWPLHCNTILFHHFPANGQEGLDSFYLGTSYFSLICTLAKGASSVRAIYLRRGERNRPLADPDLREALELYSEFFPAPGLLLFCAVVFWIFAPANASARARRDLDRITFRFNCLARARITGGHGFHCEGGESDAVTDANDTTELVHWISHLTTSNTGRQQTLANLKEALQFAADHGLLDAPVQHGVGTPSLRVRLPHVMSRLSIAIEEMKFFQTRCGCLQAALAAHSHEDALVNVKLAAASTRLAEATRHDSSAMKTIAVMTMAFLPATFFATLFALPLLDWNSPGPVVQPRFWVFWAFAIPATAVVFLIWVVITDWERVSEAGRARVKSLTKGMRRKPSSQSSSNCTPTESATEGALASSSEGLQNSNMREACCV